MLTEYYCADLPSLLTGPLSYRPCPTASVRESWEALPRTVRHRLIAAGDQYLACHWPPLPATLYMDFARTGERKNYENPYFARRRALGRLALAECAEGQGRFLDDIIAGLWAICEETSWVIPAHSRGFAGDHPLPDSADHYIDLFAAETGSLLAWAHYLLRSQLEAVTSRICEYLRREVKARILDPFLEHDDFWWMGRGDRWRLNNWSPWCVSTCLSASLLLEESADRRAAAVLKAMAIADRWLAGYHDDGGCDEGPSYWTVAGGALLDCLELLRWATGGKINVYDQPLIREIGRYIHRVHISGEYYVNFADAGGKVHLPAGVVYRYGKRIGDPDLMALGRFACHKQGGDIYGGSLLRALPDLFDTDGIEEPADPPFVRDSWLPGIQVMTARESGGTDRGLFLAAKGGHNNESHNHNDVGHFIVYYDGQPVLIDVGVGTYTAKTFSDQRYEIWTMQSAYHNLPTVNGVQPREGDEFRATDVSYRADDSVAELTMDIADAYPPEAGIKSWRRTCRLRRGHDAQVEIVEEFALKAPTREIALSLMTPIEPRLEEPGVIGLTLPSATLTLTYAAGVLDASVEGIALEDERLKGSWGQSVFRIVLKARRQVEQGVWALTIALLRQHATEAT